MKKDHILLFLAGILIMGGGVIIYSKVRGLRNNNPGNIRKTNDQWVGLAAVQDDTAFFKFLSPEYGLRAMMKLLTNYKDRYGLNTVRGLINRWAPNTENPTDQYVGFVANQIGVDPDTPINVEAQRINLAKAITRFENGIQPYSDVIYQTAQEMIT